MPKELIAIEPRKLILRDYEEKPLADDCVRVRVEYGAPKHGTELHLFRGESPANKRRFDSETQTFIDDETQTCFPMGLGNMYAGVVTETGKNVTNVKTGDRVAGYGSLRETQTCGARHVKKMPSGMSWKSAMCCDPAQFAFSGVRDGNARIGDRISLSGLGAIGMISVAMLKMSGVAFLIVVDPIEMRRRVALSLGADVALDPTKCDAGLEIKKLTDKKGVDVAIDTSGSYSAIHHGIRGLAYGGNMVCVGWSMPCKGGLDFGEEAHFNVPNIIFARACSEPNREHPRWDWKRICDTCWDLLENGKINCEEIVQPVVSFKDVVDAYRDIDEHPEKSIKLGVEF